MANNNDTVVVDGKVQPRFYQVYGDLIESKEVMEPIAITSGTGPICGFDWVDTSNPSVTITSIFKDITNPPANLSVLRGKSPRVMISDKDNAAGQVYNAYITPDGLCHIAPDVLTFDGMQPDGGWPDLSNPSKAVLFVLIASHTYTQNSEDSVPSINNFRCAWINSSSINLSYLLSQDYIGILDILNEYNIPFDGNTETIIGIYSVGWNPTWDNDEDSLRLKTILSGFNYTLCLIPMQGKFPVSPFGLNTLDIVDIKNQVSQMYGNYGIIENKLDTQVNSRGNGVEMSYTVSPSRDNDAYNFTHLVINGCVLATKSDPVIKYINSQWREGGNIGLIIYTTESIDGRSSLSKDNWGIIPATPKVETAADKWDGTFDTSSYGQIYPLALFELNSVISSDDLIPYHSYILLNNGKIDGLTRLSLGIDKLLSLNTQLFSESTKVVSGSGSTQASVDLKLMYSNGLVILDIGFSIIHGTPSVENKEIDILNLFTSINSRWLSILKELIQRFSFTYGYGPYTYGTQSGEIYAKINPQIYYNGPSNYGFLIYVTCKTVSSVGGTFGFKVSLPFMVSTRDKQSLLLACIANPFKTTY